MTVTAASAASAPGTAPASTSLSSLTSNFSDFLRLLMTQLQNQDPTSPMDTNTFTSQLVQYASVEQQINTNSSLGKLIEATQSNTVLQSSSLVGKQVRVAGDHAPLQDGQATLQFTSPTAQTVSLGIYSDSGVKLRDATIKASAGDNSWSWDGRDSAGNKVADGSYKIVAVDGSGTTLTTTATGTVTGVARTGSTVNLSLGALSTAIDNVQSVGGG
jgi:flagellar basal-body rod modification protein FlgD